MKQQILPFDHPTAYDVQDFIISHANEEAYLWVMRWPDWLHTCLSIYGERGCGKTHLSHIWQTTTKARYLRAQDFNTLTLEELFKSPYLFVLDDAHLIEKEEKLLHFYNHIASIKGNLLLLSEAAPAHWGMQLPDLRSRLHAVPSIKIDSPDEVLLTQVIQKLFEDIQVKVDTAVIEFLLKHIERSFESARLWAYTLNTFSLTSKRAITIPMVRELLSDPNLA